MGNTHSVQAPLSLEQLSHHLTVRFAEKCYTPLEIYSFNLVFKSLASHSSAVAYWPEDTLIRFLSLPDVLGVGPIFFHMASYLGAFPFPSQAPAILTSEALLRVVTLLTGRYEKALGKRGKDRWVGEIWRSLAVLDRALETDEKVEQDNTGMVPEPGDPGATPGDLGAPVGGSAPLGFAIDEPKDDVDGDYDEDDDLVLAAFETMDVVEAFRHGEKSNVRHSIVPSDNFLRLIELLIFIAPMNIQDDLSIYAARLSGERLQGIRVAAKRVLASFGVYRTPGISFLTFNSVVSAVLPYMFDGLHPFFEHFLFSKDLELLSKHKYPQEPSSPLPTSPSSPRKELIPPPPPPLLVPGEILDIDLLSQLSFFLKGEDLFHRLRPLYSGSSAGFSMGSFEKNVFNWRAPSILLVSGTLLPDHPTSARERTFADSLPPKRVPSSLDLCPSTSSSTPGQRPNHQDQQLIFGAYIPCPWKHTHRHAFGDESTLLFQLAPMHDLFTASPYSTDYIYFNKPPTTPAGLGLGTALPHQSPHPSLHLSSSPSGSFHHSMSHHTISLGPISLHLDDALEFGVFSHAGSGGGSFTPSKLPGRRGRNWQDRFEIEALEVWGLGGDKEAEAQRKAWEWEEKEAERRRRINLGTGDIDADRELLRLAGLIGGDRSGGSV